MAKGGAAASESDHTDAGTGYARLGLTAGLSRLTTTRPAGPLRRVVPLPEGVPLMPSRRLAMPAHRSAGVLLALGSLVTASTMLATAAATPAAASPTSSDDTSLTSTQTSPSGSAARAPSIEPLATRVPATTCEVAKRPGAVDLGKALSKAYPRTGYRVTLTCDVPPIAEQRQGRVVTWKVSSRKSAQVKQARTMLRGLLATDSDGNKYANARRLGVTRVVWANRVWRAQSADDGWRPYLTCATQRSKSADARCGRSGMLVVLGWAGALKQTSYWTGTVADEDFGPCRPADLSWAFRYEQARSEPCPAYPALKPPAGATQADKDLLTWSGVRLGTGSAGRAVRALQGAIGVKVTGTFSASTAAALRAWQGNHNLPATGEADSATWRAILEATLSVPMNPTPPPPPPPVPPSTTLKSTMPTTSPSGWRRIYSQDFLTASPVGSFATSSPNDWYLRSSNPYANSLRSYPDGWGTTGNVSLNYASKTVDVAGVDHDALGVFRLRAHTATVDGQRRSLAGSLFAVINPSASGQGQVAQTYGRYSVRFRTVGGYPTSGSGPRYGSAFLLWPADDVWANGEVDYPEMAWGGKVGGFVHTIGNPSVNAAVISSNASTDSGWHVATIDWKPTALVFYLDGQVLQTVTHNVPNKPFRWGFQSGGHDGTPADGVEGQLLIDWITVDAWTGTR